MSISWERANVTWFLVASDSKEMTEWLLALEDGKDMKKRALLGWEVPQYEDGEMPGLLPPITIFNQDFEGMIYQNVGSVFKKHERWAVVKDSDMFVFEMRYDRNPVLFLKLDECKVQVPQDLALKNGFVVKRSDADVVHFTAPTAESMARWLVALENATNLQTRCSEEWDAPGYLKPLDEVE
eukprot:TRINITY_DN8574_c1_g1_i4.p2 TRINITY_DN8574_c1_g1~~TRINITY_DN8574_c1_g1_i4.p2  ORF type:complete len:182 (-),score=62.46 TRINITY_DN8574_c1_g1_i4:799-1344(-)